MKTKKGALSLDFAVQIVIVLVVVSAVITAFIRYIPQDSSEIGGQETAKRGKIETDCENMCNDVKLASTEREKLEKTVDYCTAKFKSDLNENNKFERTGAGFNIYCEDGIRCFNMHECSVEGSKLGAVECAEKLCKYYQEYEELDAFEASNQIAKIYGKDENEGNFGIGTCDLENTQTHNWYNELQEEAGDTGFCQN